MMYIRLFFYCFGLIVAFMTCKQIRTKNKEIKRCHTLCYVLDVQWLSPSVEGMQSNCEAPPFSWSLPNFHLQVRKVTESDGWTARRRTEQNHSDLAFMFHLLHTGASIFLSFFFFLPPGELADSQAYRDITGRMHMLNILEERYLELMQQPWKH